MEQLQAKHRKEQRDLQSQITQKKKSASKKSRKAVNDECAKLEQDLKDRQAQETAGFDGDAAVPASDPAENDADDDLLASIADLSITTKSNGSETTTTGKAVGEADDDANQTKKPNRQKARLARRAAEQEEAAARAADEAANLPDLKAKERERMLNSIATHGLSEKEVAANGHCLYLSMADQIQQLKLQVGDTLLPKRMEAPVGDDQGDFKLVRHAAANYIAGYPDDFAAFVEEPLPDYIAKIRDTGEWGGQLELLALAKSYGIDINILQGDTSIVKIESGAESSRGTAWLAYYRHGFGLGEHYNSLRKKQPVQAAG